MSDNIFNSRRRFLQGAGLATVAPFCPGLSFGATGGASDQRFVMVILRGAMDGLAAVQPYGDKAYADLRPTLAVNENQLLKLDSFFGLHPQLMSLAQMYDEGELSLFHALATPYRERSHFDGQNVLETGLDNPDQGMSGWLNRSVPYLLTDNSQNGAAAMGIGQTMPKILDGQYDTGSWAPAVLPEPTANTVNELLNLYTQDSFLGERFSQGLLAKELATSMEDPGSSRRGQNFSVLATAAGNFLAQDNGPLIAVLESSGWDTHANQGSQQGQLANQFAQLDAGMLALKESLGSTWNNTMVLVVTEFGRTAAENGTGGTDHGTAGAGFLMGGAVNGGRIHTQWPGLSAGNLYEGRDLAPTLATHEVFAAILNQHLGIDQASIESGIIPGFNGRSLHL